MSGPFDDLLERLTNRLRVDPELRMEVTHELRTHLEDSAAEFAAGGMPAAEAHAAAIKAMGEEAEIADKLWQANRRRLRVRRAVKWTAGITLIPAAGAAAIAIGWSGILVWLAVSAIAGGGANSAILEHAESSLLASLSPQSRLIVDFPGGGDAMIENSRQLTELSPSDPIFWANYATNASQFISYNNISPQDHSITTDVPKLHKVMDIVEHARHAEPENALYPFLACSELQNAITRRVDEPVEDQPGFDVLPAGEAKPQLWTLDRYTIIDPAAFARSMADFHTAANLPFFDSHTSDLIHRRMDLLPPPANLFDWTFRLSLQIRTLLLWLNPFRQTINVAGWFAYEDAVHHHPAEALAIIHDARRLSLLAARNSHFIVELLVASGAYSQTLAEEAMVFKASGQQKEFDQALARYEEWNQYGYTLRHVPDPALPQAKARWSSIDRTLIPSVADLSLVNPAPSRDAEYAVGDRLALAAIMIGLILAAALLALDALATRLFWHKSVVVPFIGLGRMVRVLAISTIIPLAVYGLYAYATSLGGRQYGALFSVERLLVEYSTLAVSCVILARTLTDRALGQRLAEIGSGAVPPPPGRPSLAIGLFLAVVIVGYLIFWWTQVPRAIAMNSAFPTNLVGLILFPLIDLYGISWLWPTPMDEPARQSRRSAVTAFGLCLSALLLVSAAILFFNLNSLGGLAPSVAATELAVGLTLLVLCGGQWLRRLKLNRETASGPLISHSLPLALSLVSMACLMALIAGIPLSYAERQAVQRMDAPGGDYSVLREMETSRLRVLQERMNDLLAQTPPVAAPAS